MSIRNLDALFEPKSVAVVGASDRPGSIGATVWRNLRGGTFRGTTTPVNPHHRELDGVAVLRRCADLPAPHDLAIVCTGAHTLATVVAELAAAGTRAAILMAADVDAALAQSLCALARPTTMRLLGPDSLGLLSPRLGLNASAAHTGALGGNVAFVSRSGSIASAVLDWSASRRLGFSHVVALGRQMDVDFGDVLDHLASDASTRAILLHIDAIAAPRKFMSAARAAARNKPVIVVKSGRRSSRDPANTPQADAAARSDAVFDAAVHRAGMLRVDTLQELFVAVQTLARFDADVDRGLAILTNGDGPATLAADGAARIGVALSALPGDLTARLHAGLPSAGASANPIALRRDAPVEHHVAALQALLVNASTSAILYVHAPTAAASSADIARACLPLVRPAAHRMLACWLGDDSVTEARRLFDEAGVADFETPEQAVQAFSMLATYRHNQAMLLEAPSTHAQGAPDTARARAIVAGALAAGRATLDDVDGLALLAAYGIATARTMRCEATADDAARTAAGVGYPVALKVLSPDLDPRSGAARHGIADERALRRAVGEMPGCVDGLRAGARISGFAIQAMDERPLVHEMVVGAGIDPVFGPVLMYGHADDTDRAFGLPPLNRVLARDMIERTGGAAARQGRRGRTPAAIEPLCDVLVALARMQADLPGLAGVDIDPLRADEHGVLALAAQVRLSATAVAGPACFAIMPFPDELTECVDWQGRAVVIRPVRPEDESLHRDFIAHVAPGDLRLRFFSSRRELPRTELARLVQIDYAREMAFIALERGTDGTPQTLGVARGVCDPDNVDAEFAILVRSDVQGRGLGRILLAKLIRYLREHGTRRIVGYVLRENMAMRRLVETFGFEIQSLTMEPGTIYYALELQPARAPAGAAQD
jgi:acetyltransferase